MPITDIERIYISNVIDVAIDALTGHLENIRREVHELLSLALLVEKIIENIRSKKSLPQVFMYLENQGENTYSQIQNALPILFSERNKYMSANTLTNVRIVRIPEMTVASYRAESESPERDCSEVMNKFILENSLHKKSGFRHFGFNNPSPSGNNPVYGYEIWVAVPEGLNVPAPLSKKQFEGGLYASIATAMGEIGERWRELHNWVAGHDKFEIDGNAQLLEECVDFETFISTTEDVQQLDLLEPIKHKT